MTHFPREVTSVDDLVEPSLGLRGDDVVQTSPDALPVHRWDGPKCEEWLRIDVALRLPGIGLAGRLDAHGPVTMPLILSCGAGVM